ncbi:MAG TPA: type II toxin-antitoxin system VapC family toxin [Actinomycetota bacterium]|nr:type II toxin-antitoxin system VapC family toxin [Actinomycetota bacterium]
MPDAVLYLDSSAILKLVVPEPETGAVRDLLRSWPERVSSVIASIEVERAARRVGSGVIRRARTVLSSIGLVELDDAVVRSAATLQPVGLRTLDAIHLASALSLGRDLGAVCTYDRRLGEAAASTKIEVLAPP